MSKKQKRNRQKPNEPKYEKLNFATAVLNFIIVVSSLIAIGKEKKIL